MAGIMRRKGEKRVYTGRKEVDANEYKGGALRAKGQRSSGLTVGETAGYAAKSAWLGFRRVGEGVVDAALVPVDLMTGDVEQAKSRFMDSPIDRKKRELEEEYKPGKVAGFIGEVAGGIGQSIGYGLISAIPYAGKPMMYSSIVEQGISSAAEKTGKVGLKEVGYGATVGAIEGTLESKLGAGVKGIKSLGSAILKKTGLNVAESAAKAGGKSMLKSVLTETAKGFAGEFAEEAISEAVDPALLRLYNIDENAQFSMKDVAYAGLIGGLSGGIMSAGPAAINYRSAVSVGRALQESRLDGELINRAKYTLSALEAAQTRSTEQIKGKPEGDTKETAKEWLSRTSENRKVKRLSKETAQLADKIRRNIQAYENSIKDPAMAQSEPVAAILGELRGNLFLVGYSYEADVIEQVMMEADDKQRQAFVDAINEELAAQGKKHDYTLADFDANKDDIRRGLAGRLMLDELQGDTAEGGAEYGAEATESPAQAATSPWDGMADNEDMSGYKATGEAENALLKAAVNQSVPRGSVQAMLDEYRKGTDLTPEEFAAGWSDGAHIYGRYGLNVDEASPLSRMSPEAREAAMKFGRETEEAERKAAEEKAKAKKKPAAQAGKKGTVVRGEGLNVQKLSDEQYAAYKAAEVLAEVLGTDIVIETKILTKKGKEANGYYKRGDNTIHININALRNGKNVALYTLGHEITHYIKEWSPQKFEALADFVLEQMGVDAETAIADKLASLKRLGVVKDTMTVAEANAMAREELVAEGMELVLTDGKVLEELAKTDKTLWEKIRDWFFDIIGQIRRSWQDLNQASKTAQVLKETVESLEEIERLFTEGVREAGERTRTAEVDVEVRSDGNIVYAVGDEETKNATALSEEDLRVLLENVQNGLFEDGTYLPLRRNTPEFYIEVVRDHSKGKMMVQNFPMAATVEHLRQNMEEVDGRSYGEERPHELSVDDIITISKKMGDPAYIVLQKNGRYAEVVSYYDSKKKKEVVVSIDIADSNSKPPKNFKHATYMNGYEGGYYNIIVTQHELDDLQSYLKNNTVVYDKKKTNGKYQVGSGRIVTVTHDTPFVEDIVAQSDDSVNRKFSISEENSSDIRYSIDETPENADVSESRDLTDREILGMALEGAVQNEEEWKIVKSYREQAAMLELAREKRDGYIKEANALERQIKALRARMEDEGDPDGWIRKAMDDAIAKKREAERMRDEQTKILDNADRELLRMKAAKPFREIVAREQKRVRAAERRAERAEEVAERKVERARESAEKKITREKERMEEQSKQSKERKEITIRMREARRVLGYLNTMLYHPTKQKHVPESLQALVEKALRSADPKQFGINRDHIREMSELAGKIRNLESKAGRTTAEQETLDKMKTKYEKLEADTISVKRQAEALMTAFEQYVTSTTDGDQIDKNMLEGLRQTVTEIEEAPLNEMTLESLKAVEKIYTVIYHQVNTANQAFATEKATSIDQMSTEANTQVKNAKELKFLSPRSREWAALAGVRSFLWKNMKPLTVFEAIGSDKLMEIFRRVLDAEDVWITDVLEAKKVLDEAKKEFGYNKWNLKERREVTTADGSKVSLTLGEMMSLYAYNFREQAEEHLSAGGFVFAPTAEAIESFKGDKGKYRAHLNDQTTHRMRKEDIAKMSELLTEEQRAYAKAVQEYLTSLGAKGNEVSRKLYGIDLFKETAYFPIKSSHDYIETSTGKSGDPNIKSRGTFKETVPKAGNPIVLEDFMEVVGNHVNTMATYHAFVLPVEDLTRVWNYTPVNIKRDADGKAILDKNGMPVADTEGEAGYNSLKAEITKKYGKEANDYILQLLRDLNGGARRESAASILDKGLTAFKRSATMLSLSTIVQQPTSIIRAMAYVDAKHFTGASFVPWETVKKYAPVAAIKEMGGFDTGTGARTAEYINAKQYDSIKDAAKAAVTPEIYGGDPNVRAEAFGWLTGKADEVSWRYMFGAIVNEQAEKLGKAKDSEEVLKAAGKRFAEVVRRTQVYDSTLTRSEFMRSKDGLMKMATAFGAEPTTVLSMAAEAIIKLERGDKSFFKNTAAAIAGSILVNAVISSIIYAMRDDDEEKNILEKYTESVTSEIIEGFNPLEYLPIARDVMSIFKGYDIERTDMSLISNLYQQIELLTSSKRSPADKIAGVSGAVGAFFGLPITNVYRDAKGIVLTTAGILDPEPVTGRGMGNAVGQGIKGQTGLLGKIFGKERGDSYELYQAYVKGDKAHYDRVAARYDTEADLEYALRRELRENDKRIVEAAEAKHSGDLAVYESIVDQIEAEGIFDRNIVIRAINNEVSELKRAAEKGELVPKDETATDEEPAESLYTASDLNAALERGDREDFATIMAALVEDKVSTGKTEAQAKASVKSAITAYWKKQYLSGYQDTETRKRIIKLLTDTGLYGSRNDVATMCEGWVKASK